MVSCILFGVAAAFAAGADPVSAPAPTESAHRNEIETWRQQRVERLRGPTGWLTLVALDWLKEGPNTLGSAPDNSIVLAKWPAATYYGHDTVQRATQVYTVTGNRARLAQLGIR